MGPSRIGVEKSAYHHLSQNATCGGEFLWPPTYVRRLATNTANAMLNYLYAVLESETRLACAALGLDPGLGVLHVDAQFRDSLAFDVMEPIN
jgi:CRISPR/Cas system-associated endonuclease Cas1